MNPKPQTSPYHPPHSFPLRRKPSSNFHDWRNYWLLGIELEDNQIHLLRFISNSGPKASWQVVKQEPLMLVTHAYTFPNGMLMVFDDSGQQVTEYQGKTEDMIPKLIADWPDCAIIRHDQPFEITLKPDISRFTELENQIKELRAQIVFGFYEEEKPNFTQGYDNINELCEPVTATEVQNYVNQLFDIRQKIQNLRDNYRDAINDGAIFYQELNELLK